MGKAGKSKSDSFSRISDKADNIQTIKHTSNSFIYGFRQNVSKSDIYVNESLFKSYTKDEKKQYFSNLCPVCGKRISGRPCEYPYYIRREDRYLFTCDICCGRKNVKVMPDTGSVTV